MHELLNDRDLVKKHFWLLRILQSIGRTFVLIVGLLAYYGTWYYCSITPELVFSGRLADVSLGILFITFLYVFGHQVIPLLNKLKGFYYMITGKTAPEAIPPYLDNLIQLHEKGLLTKEQAQEYIDKYVSSQYPETSLPLSELERIVEKVIEQLNKEK